MTAAEGDFSGGVFTSGVAGGRAGARVTLGPSGLQAVTTEGARFELRYTDCRLRIGGASGRMVFCRSPDQSLTIFCEEKGFPEALRAAAGGLLDEHLSEARSESRAADRSSRNLMLGLSLGFVLLLVVGYFVILGLGRAALDAAPPSIDERIGQLAIEQMDLGGPVVDDPAVIEPLSALLDRLARVDPDDPFSYELTVIESSTTNAFALPGGQLAIYTGLLAKAETPEQVAGVLAHEIAHVTERHGMQGIARSIGLIVAVQFLLGDAGGLAAVATEFGRFAAENSYSRTQEAESDRIGVERLHAAGIDPGGLAAFFQLLESQHSGTALPAWFSTHPDHAARIAAIDKQVAELPTSDYAPAIPLADWAALRAAIDRPLDSPPVESDEPPTPDEEPSDASDRR